MVTEIAQYIDDTPIIDSLTAEALLSGIVLDTKQFSKGTGTKTYAAAMYLRDNNASYEAVQDLFKTNINEVNIYGAGEKW